MPDVMQLFSFDSLAQRVLYRYAFVFSDFFPIESDDVSIDSQCSLYDLFGSIVHGLTDNPSVLTLSTAHPDEWLNAHMIMSARPELFKVRNECQKAFIDLSKLLFAIGMYGKFQDGRIVTPVSALPKFTAKKRAVFSSYLAQFDFAIKDDGEFFAVQFPKQPEVLAVLQLLASKCSEKPRYQETMFMLWLHHNDYIHFLKKIATLIGLDESFCEYIDQKYRSYGYIPTYSVNEYTANCTYSKGVGGLEIAFSTLWPTVRFVNETCIGIKAMLEHADELEESIREQLVRSCKPCNGCMTCTKSGKNKQFAVAVQIAGSTYTLCPEFVQMEWYNSDISREKIDFMLELNELQVRFGKSPQKKK